MSALAIIRLLLSLANWITNRVSEAEQRKIGEDEYVRKSLLTLATSTRIAKQIDAASNKLSPDAVDSILRTYYRD